MKSVYHPRKSLILGFVIINVLVIILSIYSLFKSQQQYELRAQILTQNIASAVDKNVSSTIDKVDVALSSVTQLIDLHRANKLDKKRVNDLIADLLQRMPEVEGIRLVTRDGLVILGNGITNAVSVADRDYFIYHRDNADDKLRISKPFVGRVAKQYILVFSRRYNDPDGSFAGVIFATVSLDYFKKLLSQFDLGLDGTVVLRDSNLGLVARQPEIPNKLVGTVGNREVSKEFRQLADSDIQLSTFHTKISADGMERTFSFRRMKNAPFIVLVGMSSKEYLAGWYNEVYQMFAINFGILLLTMFSGFTLLKTFNALKAGSDRLLQQRQFSEDIINSLPGVFYMLDQEGHFIKVNSQFYDVTGYSNEETNSMNALDLLEAVNKSLISQKMQEVFESGDSFAEIDIVTKSGNKIPYYLTGHRTKIDDRIFLVGIGLDNTERKENELVQKTNQLILKNTREGFWRFNTDGYLLEVNQAYADLMGYTQEELAGKHISDISAYSNSPEVVRVRMQGIINKTTDSQFETIHRHKDGHLIYFYVSNSYLPEANCLFAFLHDITNRKLAEASLRIAATAFETDEAIMITDANANIIRVNQAFQDITGFSSEEVLGKNPRILSSGCQSSEFYTDMWQQLLTKGSWKGEIFDKRKNGQIYPKWLTITAVKNGEGNTTEYVSIFSDITARKKAEDEIYSLAFYDTLTKLPNRRFLLDRMHQALSVSARSKNYGALLFLDMDKFKTLNDTMGHDYGDLFLIEIAKRLQQCVREVDTVGRIGGDEYVLLIEEINLNTEEASQKVALVAEKIRASLASPYLIRESEFHSSPSIGVSLYRGNEETVETILKQADMAMYQAKESGGNTVRFFDPSMQRAVETRALLEADMRQAVSEKQLRLYYQIQLDSELRPLGAEALIRWIHPMRGMVSPAQFIPIAEESSLILDIGHWVLESACKQLALWSKHEQTKQLELAINVSPQQFKKHDFVDTVTTLVNIHRINPNKLKLELTERVVLEDVTDVVSKMHSLKALGVRLSLDDFGTGYSSLSYLKQLPIDQIKIDQSFVRDMTTDPNDAVMVQTIINLAQNFRMNVIAEGVETKGQLDFLKENGCVAYQGYLFSNPIPIEEFEMLLTTI